MSDITLPSHRFVITCLIVLCIIGAYIRIDGGTGWQLNADEMEHVEMAQGATLTDVVHYSLFETHPPLGNIVRHYWMMLSDAPWFLRSMSLLFGLGLIPLYYLIGNRLATPWAGLCCALLVTFSNGLIIQSWVVRNYTLFVFLLSVCIYDYLTWRSTRKTGTLIRYSIWGALACLTHFSGIFAILCIAAIEGLQLLRIHARLRVIMEWITANLLVIVIALAALAAWHPVLSHIQNEGNRLRNTSFDWFYPMLYMDYFFIYRVSTIYAIISFFILIYALCAVALRLPSVRHYTALAGFALVVAALLQLTHIYAPFVARRSLWILPFVMPPIGCLLGYCCLRLTPRLGTPALIGLLIIIGCLTYSPQARYDDVSEYAITHDHWKELTDYLRTLDSTHLIVTNRADPFLIVYPGQENLYARFWDILMHNPAARDDHSFMIMLPYHRTHLLFKPFYFTSGESDIISRVTNANAQGWLSGIQTLVIPSTLWWRPPLLISLLLCPSLEKTFVTFPQLSAAELQNAEALKKVPAIVLVIPKRVFLEDLAASTGKSHPCLRDTPL